MNRYLIYNRDNILVYSSIKPYDTPESAEKAAKTHIMFNPIFLFRGYTYKIM